MPSGTSFFDSTALSAKTQFFHGFFAAARCKIDTFAKNTVFAQKSCQNYGKKHKTTRIFVEMCGKLLYTEIIIRAVPSSSVHGARHCSGASGDAEKRGRPWKTHKRPFWWWTINPLTENC
jgi:hypothetical protein